MIAHKLHLARQRIHIGEEPRVEQRAVVDLLRIGMGLCLLEEAAHPAKEMGHRADGSIIHGHSPYLRFPQKR